MVKETHDADFAFETGYVGGFFEGGFLDYF